MIYGIDEAGRGPLLGPMAVAVVAVDDESVNALVELGVADSKRYGSTARGRAKRAELAGAIATIVPAHAVRLASPEVIDVHVQRGQLNVLERKLACALLGAVGAAHHSRVICDGARVFGPLVRSYPALEAVDKGESFHVSVAAASVLAKHARDEAFEQIAARYADEFGPLSGGGYINPATRRFVTAYRDTYGELPPEARRSWSLSF